MFDRSAAKKSDREMPNALQTRAGLRVCPAAGFAELAGAKKNEG
ncbi:hypothetical protein [Anaeroselena agilis]|uniref:Uncharacterized protein n=1 Tax=Anaeroselena agilis TaxID=3063788 RepID=A0ABU3NTU1_9FIRM|nr:hypothetical protein [Selenomonadales bacterium 4137-cl]